MAGTIGWKNTKLSKAQPTGPIKLTSIPEISSDSRFVIFLQDAASNGRYDLFRSPISGGAPMPLSFLMEGEQIFGGAAITKDSARCIYISDQELKGKPELYSARMDNGQLTKISKPMAFNRQVRDFKVGYQSKQVYYASDSATNNTIELWRVMQDGGTSTKLSRPLPNSGYDVFEYAVAVTSDGVEMVVYRVGSSVSGGYKLYSITSSGNFNTEISRRLVAGGGVSGHFEITNNDDTVIYLADAEVNGKNYLYKVPITGGPSVRLSHEGRNVLDSFIVSGQYVKFSYGPNEYYSVHMETGTIVQIAAIEPPPMYSSDNRWSVYKYGDELHSHNLFTGAHQIVNCPGQTVTFTFVGKPVYSISRNSVYVVYVANNEVWSARITGARCW